MDVYTYNKYKYIYIRTYKYMSIYTHISKSSSRAAKIDLPDTSLSLV